MEEGGKRNWFILFSGFAGVVYVLSVILLSECIKSGEFFALDGGFFPPALLCLLYAATALGSMILGTATSLIGLLGDHVKFDLTSVFFVGILGIFLLGILLIIASF